MNAVIARILDFWARQPVLVSQLVTQAIVLLVAFNVPISQDQGKAFVAIVEILGQIVAGIVIHNTVYSPATVTSILAEQALPATPVPPGA